jgi:hypothetical protein
MNEKQKILIESYHRRNIVYLIKIENNLYKYGKTCDIKARFIKHKILFGDNINLIYCIESENNNLLEQRLKDYLTTTEYGREKIYNHILCNELIEIDDIEIITNIMINLNKNLLDDEILITELKKKNKELLKIIDDFKNKY